MVVGGGGGGIAVCRGTEPSTYVSNLVSGTGHRFLRHHQKEGIFPFCFVVVVSLCFAFLFCLFVFYLFEFFR